MKVWSYCASKVGFVFDPQQIKLRKKLRYSVVFMHVVPKRLYISLFKCFSICFTIYQKVAI